jgi:hypothetical protein
MQLVLKSPKNNALGEGKEPAKLLPKKYLKTQVVKTQQGLFNHHRIGRSNLEQPCSIAGPKVQLSYEMHF